ncbi:hypothetical protein Prubr_30790 [Polymorphospora rubra]|uniref:Uncharacterized protein n=1 Tax=Polymorphospora rubra TaxID=338584 RepID=A0A810N2X9_9ACTN|nr:ice-binding family protein [Polymorphospora rubra]BCJ66058.1 hypothetical protein Prubr_30790 [Polymorphospora rubra]
MTVNAALRAPARRGLRRLALALSGALASGVVLAPPPAYAANGPVSLGAADRYAVLAGETVNNVGNSVIGGDLGVSPGETLAGFPPGVVNGERHPADESAEHAQRDLTSAYDDASNRVSTDPTGTELGGKTLAPGVYTSTDAVALTGTLTLDARGTRTRSSSSSWRRPWSPERTAGFRWSTRRVRCATSTGRSVRRPPSARTPSSSASSWRSTR